MFALDRLHRIDIVVDPADLDALEHDRSKRVPCRLRFDDVELAGVGIRQKEGGGSRSDLDGKPGLSIKFDEFKNGQKLDGLGKLVLNNAIQDASLIHEHLGYELYRRARIPAPRTAHAEVTLNGRTEEPATSEAVQRDLDGFDAELATERQKLADRKAQFE